jgi:hypothetical protein
MPAGVPGRAGRPGGNAGERESVRRRGGDDQVGRLIARGPVDDRFGQPAPRGLNGAHLGQQLNCGGPVARMLGQTAADQRPDLLRQQTQAGRAVDQPVNQRGIRPRTERPLGRTGEGEHRTQAEHVTRRSDFLTENLLGGHEAR